MEDAVDGCEMLRNPAVDSVVYPMIYAMIYPMIFLGFQDVSSFNRLRCRIYHPQYDERLEHIFRNILMLIHP